MRLIIEARIADGEGKAKRTNNMFFATIDRRDEGLSQLGLGLAQGRSRRLGASHGFARSHALLQIRCAVLNGRYWDEFSKRDPMPTIAANDPVPLLAA